jgi:hypothetical protein
MNESFNWVLKAIETSTSSFHVKCCDTLISLFCKKYGPPNGGSELFDKNLIELCKCLTTKEKTLQ